MEPHDRNMKQTSPPPQPVNTSLVSINASCPQGVSHDVDDSKQDDTVECALSATHCAVVTDAWRTWHRPCIQPFAKTGSCLVTTQRLYNAGMSNKQQERGEEDCALTVQGFKKAAL